MVSAESNNAKPQEQELWDRITTTEGAERAEVLDELSHVAYNKENYNECLQLVDTSIDIYFSLGLDGYIKELIHAYEGKAFCLRNLKRTKEAAETFEEIAQLHEINDDTDGYIRARRAAACDWFEIEEWQKSLDGHIAAKDALNPEATPYSMGIDHINIAMAHEKLKNFNECIHHYKEARKLFKEAKNPEYVNWCDNYLARVYADIENGLEAKVHAQHYFNYSKVAEDLTMEGYAHLRLGCAYLASQEFEAAQTELTVALEMLTLEDHKDWEHIVKANQW